MTNGDGFKIMFTFYFWRFSFLECLGAPVFCGNVSTQAEYTIITRDPAIGIRYLDEIDIFQARYSIS